MDGESAPGETVVNPNARSQFAATAESLVPREKFRDVRPEVSSAGPNDPVLRTPTADTVEFGHRGRRRRETV